MGIWGNIADRLTGALCKNLITDLLTKVGLPGTDILSNGNPLDKIPVVSGFDGILGQGQNGNNAAPGSMLGFLGQGQGQSQGQGQRPPARKPAQNSPLGFGGLFGGGQRNSRTSLQGPSRMTSTTRFPIDF